MSDSPELLKPDEVTDSQLQIENEKLRRQLENTERLVDRKNEEILKLNSQLVEVGQKTSELNDRIEELESELPEAADLYNELKGKRPKTKTVLADVELMLEICRRWQIRTLGDFA